MKTLIFDIDGTLTNMWPIERATLLAMSPGIASARIDQLKAGGTDNLHAIYTKATRRKMTKSEFTSRYRQAFNSLEAGGKLPKPAKYPAIAFIRARRRDYRFVYATGGLCCEAEYVLGCFGIKSWFDLANSTSKDMYPFSKRTGRPFRKIQAAVGPCCLISDGAADIEGAKRAGIAYQRLAPGNSFTTPQS